MQEGFLGRSIGQEATASYKAMALRGSRSICDERLVETADVVAIYQIALGRNPESDLPMEAYQDASTRDVIARILLSAEMSQLAANAMADGFLPHPTALTASDFRHASSWLGIEVGDSTLEDLASWWLLIDRFVNELWRARLGQDIGPALADYATMVAARADADKSMFARMRSSMVFDAEWFSRAHARSIATYSPEAGGSPARYFLSTGRLQADQLLAAFSGDIQHIYDAVPSERRSSLAAYVEAIVEAAGRGETAHWLFDAEFCRAVHARRAQTSAHATIPVSYLQFLLDGDREEWAPHPLFSHYAYRRFNALPDDRLAFEDYLIRGIFEECRTSSLFDPDYYLNSHRDARLALLRGTHYDALHHFLTVGIYSDYKFLPDFDVGYYCELYPDVIEDVRRGDVPSASWHFLHRGLNECRRPNRAFDPRYYVQRHPHVVAEMAHIGLVSLFEHFLLVGRGRGLKAEPPLVERRPEIDDAKVVFGRRALRSLDRQWRSPFDFRPFATENPVLSVIVPVSNEASFTALFLECAYFAAAHMFHSGIGGVEVIVVDNGSTDRTALLVELSVGTKSMHFPDAIGYPSAINEGIRLAAGKFVIVANNDVFFQPDAFVLAVAALEADQTIGVLGPLVILPNETLQEAGSFVDRGGGIVNSGRFENPWDAYFRGLIEADYCAGCFFAFRQEDLERIGGVDEAFSPGYYEDVDLSFRMRGQLGKRTVVLPDLQVIHFEHASFGKGRPPSSAFAAIQRNQALFLGKHSEALLDRPTRSVLAPNGIANTMAIGRSRVLVIADTIPHFGNLNSRAGTLQILRGLEAAGQAFELLVLQPDFDVDAFEDIRVTTRRAWMPGESAEIVLADAGHRYSHVLLTGLDQLDRFAPQLEPIRKATGLRIICYTSGLEAPTLLGGNAPAQALLDTVRLELRTSTRVTPWLGVDARECALIEEAGLGRAISIAMTPAFGEADRPSRANRNGVLLLGGARSCVTALAWLEDHIDPPRSQNVETIAIVIAGGWDTRLALRSRRHSPRITLEIATPSDERSLQKMHDQCHVAMAPPSLRSLAEVLLAMSLDVPVVLSRALATLLREDGTLPDGLAIVTDEGGASYGAWLERLTVDPNLWIEVQIAQRAMLAERRRSENFASDFASLIEM